MTTDTPNVWVVHEPLGQHGVRIIDLSDAHRFGRVRHLLPAGGREVLNDPVGAIETVRRKFADYRAGDYLLLTGSPIAIAMASAILSNRTGGSVKVLCWDRERRCYTPVPLEGLAA